MLGCTVDRVAGLAVHAALGVHALPYIAEALDEGYTGEPIGPQESAFAASHYFNYRKLSIYGGSNEIQEDIISKMVLGL